MKTTYMLHNLPLDITYEFFDTDLFEGCPYVEIDDISLYGYSIDVRGLYWNGQELDEFLSDVLVKILTADV